MASNVGWQASIPYSSQVPAVIAICHFCLRPTLLDAELGQIPGPLFGKAVADIPDESVQALYTEARQCMATSSYTAVVLCCRKLLMHVAVSKGAEPGKSFLSYVEYLASKNYIPPDAREWVDHIRVKSNEANHEIAIMGQADAEDLLAFSEMLLKVIYEFPATVQRRSGTRARDA